MAATEGRPAEAGSRMDAVHLYNDACTGASFRKAIVRVSPEYVARGMWYKPSMTRRRGVSVGLLAIWLGSLMLAARGASPAQQPPHTPVTGADLLSGLKNPSRWLTFSGDYTG